MKREKQKPRAQDGRAGLPLAGHTGAKFAFLLAVVLVVTTGCLAGASADEVREDALDSMETVDTYGFEANTTVEVSVGNETPSGHSVTMESEGTVDEKEGALEMRSTVKTFGTEVDQDVYVMDGTMYTRTDGIGMSGEANEWYKIDEGAVVSSTLDSSSHTEQYEETLEISDVNHDRDAELDGEPVHVLSLDPDPQEYGELMLERIGSMGTTRRLGEDNTDEEGVFGDADVRVNEAAVEYWVSKETGYVLRTRADVNMTTPMPLPHQGEREVTMDARIDVRMFDHGDDAGIELPDGAQNASDFEELLTGDAAGSTESTEAPETDGASTDLSEAPDADDVDRTTDGIVDRYEFEVEQSEAFGETHTATVYVEDSFEAETLTVEGLESGSMVRTDSPGSARYLSVAGVEEGEEIAVTATKEDGTVVRQSTAYEP